MKPSPFAMRQLIKSVFALSTLSCALYSGMSFADELSDASKLLKSGQLVEAMQKVDSALVQRPKDAQLRFLKGLILVEQNKNPEAITIFSKLTDDYPELPEPYNNLAVLYASSAQYDKARAALEMAIRTNPTYGTAHENLGDIYAKLASQAYDKALQLDSGNSGAKMKLTLVKNLIGNTTGGTNPKVAMAAKAAAQQAASSSANTANTTPVVTASKTAAPQVAKADNEKAELSKSDKAEAKTNASAAKTSVAQVSDQDEIQKFAENWAKAWSNKDVQSYLASYAKDFQTPKGESRKKWAEERKERIEGKGRISVKMELPKITVNGSTATFKFRQIYTSDQLTANSRKTLDLVKHDGKWLIKQERTGN